MSKYVVLSRKRNILKFLFVLVAYPFLTNWVFISAQMAEVDISPPSTLDEDNAKDETHKESTFCKGKFILF